MRYLSYFVITLSVMVSEDVKAHQILHEGFHHATLEDIQLWNDRYVCELNKIVLVDQDGRGVASVLETNEPLRLEIDKSELLVESNMLMASNVIIDMPVGMHISKAYGGELIAHSNIGNMKLDKDGNFFLSWSSFNWDAGSTGIVFTSGVCK